MKKLFLYLSILVFLSSCSNEEDDSMKNPFKFSMELSEELRNEITEIVPVADLTDGSQHIIGKSYKTAKGFEVHLQNPLNQIFLYPLSKFANFQYGQIDCDVMCYGAVTLFAYNGNKAVGVLSKTFIDEIDEENCIAYYLKFMYVTGDATVKGDCIIDEKLFRSHDVNLNSGWNLYTSIEYTGSHIEYTSNIPHNLIWDYSIKY